MDMFFENRAVSGEIKLFKNAKHIFPLHFHIDLEIFLLKKGKFEISLNGKEYVLGAGDIAVIDSYDVHSYDKNVLPSDKESLVVIIPYRYLSRFNSFREYFKIKTPVISAPTLCDELIKIADAYMGENNSESVRESATDLFLSLLLEKLEFSNDKRVEESVLIRNILAFIQENYRENVSLEFIAKSLGYTTAHVSRAFHKYIKTSLPSYVNRLRLDYIDKALQNGTDKKITHLIYEAGFSSQQTYYRERKNQNR